MKKRALSQAQLAALGIEAQRELTLATLLARPQLDYAQIAAIAPPPQPLDEQVCEQAEIAIKYEGYIKKQLEQVERFRRLEERRLPSQIDYLSIKALSSEGAQKLDKYRPASIGQAGRISGVSPADVNVLLIWLEQQRAARR